LFFSDGPRLQGGRRLHRDEREHLEQVRDDHVLVRAGDLVEGGATVEAEGLGDVDLDVVDEVAVPDGLEQTVGEAERQDVLGRLLAEEVVDPEDLALPERLVQLVVERDRALQVGAERLLHHDPRTFHQVGVAQRLDDRGRGHGRDAQVMEPADVLAELLLGDLDRLGEPVGPGALGDVGEPLLELLPLRRAQRVVGELVHRLLGERAELALAHVLERGPDHLDVGGEGRQREVREAGEQLASREVAGGAEEDDDVRDDRLHPVAGGAGADRRVRDGLSLGVQCHEGDVPTLPGHEQGRGVRRRGPASICNTTAAAGTHPPAMMSA
jgi:hypothetical protein